ncbi:hypothetical protein AK830_g10746 [Neonectria ditissima]|uniref:F-box domain-containing protein n=1 Tax=Neonectria ditissima TaxID=78410 RepID=A0A0P7ASP7_9HYPO|nr:hypothetical protein AK830_g10746 [Neonectria ditissima]
MKKIKRFLAKVHSSRRRSSQHHAPPALSLALSSTSSWITEADSADGVCTSILEQLPFEMRHQILLAVDTIDDLNALVHASPTYHQQYRLGRAFWLWRSLWLDMGPVLIDAYTANLGMTLNSRPERNYNQRTASRSFITSYHLRRSTTAEALFASASTEEIINIAAFYSSTIRPLLPQYVAWTRNNLGALSMPDQLSKTERTRIVRGMYRFQIFCNVFSNTKYGQSEKMELFLGAYDPWEIEELICIERFASFKFQSALDEVEKDLHPDDSRFDIDRWGPFTPDGSFNPYDKELYQNGMVALGLAHLCATLKVQDHSELVDFISESLVLRETDSIYETIEHCGRERDRAGRVSDRDRAQYRRDKMPFVGDRIDSPPLAWVTIWREEYSNLICRAIPKLLHDWGYVMWDADRLVDSGALAVFEKEWNEWYLDQFDEFEDPRASDPIISQ